MAQIIDGKYIIELDEQTSIALTAWLPFQPNAVPDQAFRISLENFIKALPIIPAVAGEYANIAAMLAAQPGQTVDVFYKVADPSDDPDYNDLKDSEIKSVYYHLVDVKTGSLSNYNSIAIPKLESSKFPKLGNSLEAVTFDVKFRTAEWSSNQATLQAISNALKLDSPQDLLLSAESVKLLTDNMPTNVSRVLFGSDGQLIFEEIDATDIQNDADGTDVTLNDAYQLLLTITPNQQIIKGIAEIGLTAKSFSTGAITAFQASGNNRVRATSAAHGFSEGDYVEIVNTANYDGIYEIKAVPNVNDFDFTSAFVATEIGDWEKSENREIAVDLRVDAVSKKEFLRTIEGEARLNFSEQLEDIPTSEDIEVFVKSNTLGEAIEILGTSDSSELNVININVQPTQFIDYYVASWGNDGTAKPGRKDRPWALASIASVAAKADKDANGNNNRVYIFSGGAIYDNEINQDDIPIFAEDQAVVWTDVAMRSILSDRLLGNDVKCEVECPGQAAFVHTNPSQSPDQQSINFGNAGADVNVKGLLIDSIQMWNAGYQSIKLENCEEIVGSSGLNRTNTDSFLDNCKFNYSLPITRFNEGFCNFVIRDGELILDNIYDREIYDKEGNLILTVDVSQTTTIRERLIDAYSWRCPAVGASGNGDVNINSVDYLMTFNTSEEQTVDDFVDTHEAALLATQDEVILKRWKEIQLTGTSGTATITIAGTGYLATFNTDLETTAADFITTHESAINTQGFRVEQFGSILAFSKTAEAAFTLTIANASGDLNGTISYQFYLRAIYENYIEVSYVQNAVDLIVTFVDYFTLTELEDRIAVQNLGENGYAGLIRQFHVTSGGSEGRGLNFTCENLIIRLRKKKTVGTKIIYTLNELDGRYGNSILRNTRILDETGGSGDQGTSAFIYGKDDALATPAEIDLFSFEHSCDNGPRVISASGYSAPVIRSNDPSIDNSEIFEKNALFKKQATVQGATISFSATPTFNFDSGNVQKMIVTGTITSLSISNELNAGSYRIFLEIDSVASPAIPTADATFGAMTDNSVSAPINSDNDVNIYDITVDPDGTTYYSIETITA